MTITLSLPYFPVHQTPYRSRLRLPWGPDQAAQAVQLQTQLQSLPELGSVRLNWAARSLIIHHPPQYPLLPQLEAALGQLTATTPESPPEEESLLMPVVAVALAAAVRLPQGAWVRPLAFLALVRLALPIAQRAWHSLWTERRLSIDALDLLALTLSGVQGKLLTPALVIFLHALGDDIRDRTARATEGKTLSLMDALGRWAWVKPETGEPVQVPSDRVVVGDTVVVYPGEQIPVDGTVLQGEAWVDQQSLTGESLPVAKQTGDRAWASTLVRSGQIYLRAERVGDQTRAAASIALLSQAPVHDTRMANYAEKLADRLIGPALLLAVVVGLATGDPSRAAAILTLDFVTGIRVSIPTAFLSALNHTTRHGVLVRSGRTLEQLAEVDTVVFDKTGTLTQGSIAVTGLYPQGGCTPERLLQLAATAEQRLTHPVAEAIVKAARSQGLTIPPRGAWNYQVGLGVEAEVEGQRLLVGSRRFLLNSGFEEALSQAPDGEESWIDVAWGEEYLGAIAYSDPLRPESATLITTLQQDYGLGVYLLTGDRPHQAHQVAARLGIPTAHVYAEAFPEQKAKVVRDLHRSGHTVAFVGDGLNDSVALAYADVSISFAGGTDIARETADVVLMNDQLLDILEVMAIARETRHLIDQNSTLVVAPNLIALGLAASFGLNPLLATLIHNGSAILAAMNSLRPLLQHQLTQQWSD